MKCTIPSQLMDICDGQNINACIPHEEDDNGGDVDHLSNKQREELDGPDWEHGSIPISCQGTNNGNMEGSLIVEFNVSTVSSRQRQVRRVSPEDKELAELVHKVHLLCLLARGRSVDSACNDPLIQASLLSLLPAQLLKMADVPKLTKSMLYPLVQWFHSNFRILERDISDTSFISRMASALETREGNSEEVAALSVALFRALNLTSRFVAVLDASPLKPESGTSRSSKNDFYEIKSSSESVTPLSSSFSFETNFNTESSHGISQSCEDNTACHSTQSKNLPENLVIQKRKGDIEFELQLEMALSSSAVEFGDKNIGSNSEVVETSSPNLRNKKIKLEDSSQRMFTATGSRIIRPVLYWAEVYCNGEPPSGRWIHVDAANNVIDGEQKVESIFSSCRTSLRYVVAFAGHGAKDVTRRYCLKWYKISSQRIDSLWWDAVLAPLKELESGATDDDIGLQLHQKIKSIKLDKLNSSNQNNSIGSLPVDVRRNSSRNSVSVQGSDTDFPEECNTKEGPSQVNDIITRSSLEDMELQTRALTEPLPTNQQAYRNHPLYAIEKWLTKYQILHPKDPVLGYCSGHSVYPRTCVQTLQTREKWLRDGLQVKETECPSKVVKRSQKISRQEFELGVSEDKSHNMIQLYGKWQTEKLNLPCAINGIVPKNERGRVDVWSEKCLPPGTLHLRLPRLIPIVKRLGIDFAPAMIGFEFRNGRSVPVIEGIVICHEFKDAVLEAYAEEEQRREQEEKRKTEADAISRWYQLLSSILTRERLKRSYDLGSTFQTQPTSYQSDHHGVETTKRKQIQEILSNYRPTSFSGDHEHVYPMENQSFDEETSIRTKRCPCGFSIQIEEL